MSRVLILDDEQYRHDAFAVSFAGHELVHVRSASEAAEALRGPRFDLAQLDHDLGGHWNGTGRDVAEHIAAMPAEARPRLVIVHSFNPPGARLMVATLKQAGVPASHRPFSPEVL